MNTVPNADPYQVDVSLGERGYPIYIGSGLLAHALERLIAPHVATRRLAVVTNETVRDLYLQTLTAGADWQLDVFCMPDGEVHKNLATYGAAMDFLIRHRHNRDTCVVALGGGVVGDLAGFVAATYQRGVNLVQIPTTLLAQVDSSVGGKTAVNHSGGKNMIGAFYQPRCVVMDLDVLRSLPAREFAAGLAEIVKYGVIWDAQLFAYLETHVHALLAQDAAVLAHVVRRSCEIKAEVVSQDERESGVRAILNFGHTFGHAIENLSGYGTWLHGEAVALGMAMAARYSVRLGMLDEPHAERIVRLLEKLSLPVVPKESLPTEEMLRVMGMDKKAAGARLTFVLAQSLGQVVLHSTSADDPTLLATLHDFKLAAAT